AVNHDVSVAAVDGGDDALAADGVAEPLREREVRLSILEERRAGDDLLRAGGKHVLRAIEGADAASDAARDCAGDLPHDREVVATVQRRVQIDDLHFREALEPAHPAKDVIVLDREPLALHELHDGAALEIDGRDQHPADGFALILRALEINHEKHERHEKRDRHEKRQHTTIRKPRTKRSYFLSRLSYLSCLSCLSWLSWRPLKPNRNAVFAKMLLQRAHAGLGVMKDRRRERRVGA